MYWQRCYRTKEHAFMMITWATWLTIGRIILTPFIVRNLAYEQWTIAGILFAIAALSDTLDGALARYTGQETQLGAYLDPLADKFLIVSCYMTLLYVYGTSIGIPLWLTVMVVMREITLVGGAFVLYVRSLHVNSPIKIMIYPTLVGKLTTVVHCVLLSTIYSVKAGLWQVSEYYIYGMSVMAASLMIASGIQYGVAWWRLMRAL